MQIKVHLSGCAIAYENNGGKLGGMTGNSRPQGSLYSQQKRAIADAIEWMRLYGVNKPLFFVATSPGKLHAKDHQGKIRAFTDNLRHNYGLRNYVWVRELTPSGLPHYHFVADIPFIADPIGLSRYWSGLFGSDANNSLRLGSKPINGIRKFYVDSPTAARYVSKYIGKDLDTVSDTLLEAGFPQAKYKKTYRSFAISQEARLLSQPEIFECDVQFREREAYNTTEERVIVKEYISVDYKNYDGELFDKTKFRWKRLEPHNVWLGFKQSFEAKKQ